MEVNINELEVWVMFSKKILAVELSLAQKNTVNPFNTTVKITHLN